MSQFHETGFGQKFFNSQLPQLIKVLEKIGKEAERSNNIMGGIMPEQDYGEEKTCDCDSNIVYIPSREDVICDSNIAYILSREDVISVLVDMGHEEIAKDEEQLRRMMTYIRNKLSLPWYEYMQGTIELKLEMDKKLDK